MQHISTRLGLFFVLAALIAAPALAQAPNFSKSFFPSTIGPGSVSTLTFTINNAGSSVVRDLAFTDSLPAGMTIATPANALSTCLGSLSAPDSGSLITFTDGGVGSFSTCTLTVNVTASTAGTLTNVSGELTSDAGSSGTATADLIVATDRPGFTKSLSPNNIFFGDRSTLTFTIDNTANTAQMIDLRFTDTMPRGMVVASPSNAVSTCDGSVVTAPGGGSEISIAPEFFGTGSVAANSSCTVTVDVVGNAIGSLGNISGELTSRAITGFQTLSSGLASDVLTVTTEQIALSKSFVDDPAAPGETVTLEFTVRNLDRRSSATNIAFTDDLGATLSGLTASSLPTQPCGAGSSLTGESVLSFSGGELGTESTCTFSVVLQVPAGAAAGNYTNTTSPITADFGGSSAVGNPATDVLSISPVPALTKTFLDNPVGAGSSTTLEFTITNTSPTFAASEITFEDVFDIILPTASATPADDFCGTGSTALFTPLVNPIGTDVTPAKLTVSGANLPAGGSCTFSITLDVVVGAATGIYDNTTSDVSAIVGEELVSGGPASDSLNVIAAPSLNKEFTDDPVSPGDTVTLQFTLTHDENAPGPATGISFSDDLTAALTGLTATGLPLNNVCGVGSQIDGTNTLLLTDGSLAAGESCTFSVTLDVPGDAPAGRHTNTTSSVVATVLGTTVMENGATDDLEIAGLTLSKSFLDNPAFPGGTVTLEFTIENMSPVSAASNIIFLDDLDAALDNLAATSDSLPQSEICGPGSALIALGTNSRLLFQAGSLDPGTSCTFSVTLDIPPGTVADTYTNTTSSFSGTIGGATVIPDNAIADLVIVDDFLFFEKDFVNDPVSPGDNVVLRFTITNLLATGTISNIGFTDDLDAALSGLVSVSGTQNDVCGLGSQISGTSTLTFTGGELAAEEACSFDVILSVPTTVDLGTGAVNTTSEITGSVGALAIDGDAATDTLQIDSINFSKSFDVETTTAGSSVVLTFQIENLDTSAGESELFFIDELDTMIPGSVATDLPKFDVCGTGSSLTGTSSLLFADGELLPGGSCTFTVTVDIPLEAEPGNYTNETSDLQQGPARSSIANAATAPLTVTAPPDGTATLYCSDDINNRDTQVFTVAFPSGEEASLGPVQPLADLETLALSPVDGQLFGIKAEGGQLFDVDKTTGALTQLCIVPSVRKFREIAGSSYHPTTGELWAYQWNRGLITIDTTTCDLVRQWNHPYTPGVARKWDGIAWRPDGSVLYGSQRTDLYAWNPLTATAEILCSNLPDKTEGLEYSPFGVLYGSSNSKIYEIDPDTCSVIEIFDVPGREDIESLTFEE